MFFILSKALYFLIMPFTIICILFLISVLIKNVKIKNRIFWTALIGLWFFSNEFIANEVMNVWEIKAVPFADMKRHKLGIVLTGSTISGLEPNDRVYFNRGADRVTHTVQLFKKGIIERILISGGSGKLVERDEPEANKFSQAMQLMGVPAEAIIIENATRNTAESAIEVTKILTKYDYGEKDCLLITSAFHMRRSLASYKKAGLDLEPFSTDFYGHPRDFHIDSLIIPQIEAMQKWHKLIKEWIGYIAYKIVGYI
jgi:uncharacterized SAM-binding protein YcdF (DUF218 family)